MIDVRKNTRADRLNAIGKPIDECPQAPLKDGWKPSTYDGIIVGWIFNGKLPPVEPSSNLDDD